jgi:hypothetical protein
LIVYLSRTVSCALLAVLLAACARPAEQPRFNLSGYSAVFKRGYADGCASASGTQRRDDRLYRSDTDYMMGWNDGRSACK